jgi:hypothetical protein
VQLGQRVVPLVHAAELRRFQVRAALLARHHVLM